MNSRALAQRIRVRILDGAFRANKGHIGSALSVADIVAAIAPRVSGLGTDDPERDRFVLSKGHAALAWYSALAELGILSTDDLAGYGIDGSLLGTHPDPALRGVDFMTGSLGQGFSFGVGSAVAATRAEHPWRTWVVLSDSELDEGVTWESALLAAQLRCTGLTVVLDQNGQQALGFTKDVIDTSGVPAAFEKIGWRVTTVDGHSADELDSALELHGGPHLIVARTTAGHGVDFMERRIKWHYLPMTLEQYESALEQVNRDVINA